MGGHTFKIELANPNKTYWVGQTVEGRVVLQIDEEKKTGGIKIKCMGVANVHFTETQHAHGHTHGHGHGAHGHTHNNRQTRHYSATEKYFEFKVYVFGEEGAPEQTIPPGTHTWPFSFQIPPNVPSSFQGKHGQVQYSLEANLKRSWKFDYKAVVPITVNSLVDLNTWPGGVTYPVNFQKDKYLCCLCCKSGPVTMRLNMDRTGFVPGQPLDFIMEVDNKSTTDVTRMFIELHQDVCFRAQGHSKTTSTKVMHLDGPGAKRGESELWRGTTAIPALPPSGLGFCRIIELSYTLKAILDIPGAINLNNSVNIVIGTIPLREQFSHFQPFSLSQPQPSAPFKPGIEPGIPNIFGTGDAMPAAPFAPVLFPDYPDLPPPTYAEATRFDGNQPEYPPTTSENNDGAAEGSAPTFDPNFVPKYPTYGWVQ